MAFPIVSQLNDLAVDVSLNTVARGDLFFRGASRWHNLALGSPGQALVVTDLGGGVLEPRWGSAGVTQHHALVGLGADDHGQYLHLTPGDTTRNTIDATSTGVTPLTLKGIPGGASPLLNVVNEANTVQAYLGGDMYSLYVAGESQLAGPVGGNSFHGITHGGELKYEAGQTRFLLSSSQNFGIEIGGAAKGAYVKAAPSQTGDLLQFQNSSGTVLSRFDENGRLGIGADPSAELYVAGDIGLNGSRPAGTDASNRALWLDGGRSFIKGYDNASYSFITMGCNVHLNAYGLPSRQTSIRPAWFSQMGSFHLNGSFWDVAHDTGAGFQNVFFLDVNGQLGLGGGFTSGAAPGGQLHVRAGSSARIGLLIGGAASQAADLLRIQSNTGTGLFRVSPSGNVGVRTAPSSTFEDVLSVEGYGSATQNIAMFKVQGYPAAITVWSEYGGYDGEARYRLRAGDTGGWGNSYAHVAHKYFGNLTLYNDKEAVSVARTTGRVGINRASSVDAQLHVVPHAAADPALILQGTMSQSGDFLRILTSAGDALVKIDAGGRSFWSGPATAPADGDLLSGGFTAWIDEANHKLKFRVRYADGATYKSGEIALS